MAGIELFNGLLVISQLLVDSGQLKPGRNAIGNDRVMLRGTFANRGLRRLYGAETISGIWTFPTSMRTGTRLIARATS